MMIPEYTELPYRSCHQALKLLRQLLKGYYVESRDAMQPRMPKWWWLQQNFDALRGHSGLRGTLIIMREKKGTRRGKSLYYQTLREKGIYPRERNVPPVATGAGRLAPSPAALRFTAGARHRVAEAFGVDPFARGAVNQQAVQQVAPMNPAPTVGGWNFRVNNLDMDGNIVG